MRAQVRATSSRWILLAGALLAALTVAGACGNRANADSAASKLTEAAVSAETPFASSGNTAPGGDTAFPAERPRIPPPPPARDSDRHRAGFDDQGPSRETTASTSGSVTS